MKSPKSPSIPLFSTNYSRTIGENLSHPLPSTNDIYIYIKQFGQALALLNQSQSKPVADQITPIPSGDLYHTSRVLVGSCVINYRILRYPIYKQTIIISNMDGKNSLFRNCQWRPKVWDELIQLISNHYVPLWLLPVQEALIETAAETEWHWCPALKANPFQHGALVHLGLSSNIISYN